MRRFPFSLFCLPLAIFLILSFNSRAIPQIAENELKTVRTDIDERLEFVALGDLAELLNLRTFYSEKAHKVILYVGETQVKVTAMNPFVQIGERMVQMPVETRYANDDILVPLHAFTRLIRPLHRGGWPKQLQFENATPAEKTPPPNIFRITVEDKTNGTLIRIQTAQPFARRNITTRASRNWMYVDILDGRIAAGAVAPLPASKLVKEIKPVQTGNVAQLSFHLLQDVDAGRINISGQGNDILVSIPTQEVVPTEVLRNLDKERQKWRIDTIVIDPGHGGRDPGAIGPTGIQEKDITLQVGLRLRKLIEKELGLKVIMTREKDEFIKLDERTQKANAAQGKLFLSLHCNANRSRRVNGATTYFLGPARTDEALEVALLENSVLKYESDQPAASEEEFILAAMAQNAFNHESENLAEIVQQEMENVVGLPDRGVYQAGFYVLVGASMPNVLVEMAFISNQKEERLLNSPEVQQKIAQALCNSVKRFKQKYETGS